MGKVVSFIVALVLLGVAVWYLFLREKPAPEPASAESSETTPGEKKSVLGRAYQHSENTVDRVSEQRNTEVENVINSM